MDWWKADPDEDVMQERGFDVPLGTHWAVGGRIARPGMPVGAAAVILCALTRSGLRPLQICLEGQIERTKVAKMVTCADAEEIVAVPVRSEEYVTIWSRKRVSTPTPATGAEGGEDG